MDMTRSKAELCTPRVRSACASILLSVIRALVPRRLHALAEHQGMSNEQLVLSCRHLSSGVSGAAGMSYPSAAAMSGAARTTRPSIPPSA